MGTNSVGQQPLIEKLIGNKAFKPECVRKNVVDTLESQLYVREFTGNNDGKDIKKYLNTVGLGEGYAWCAAFVSWTLEVNNVPNPLSAWSPDFGREGKYLLYKRNGLKQDFRVRPGMVFTLYYSRLERIGHVGFIMYEDANYFYTIEGNTNMVGSREGDGVYLKKRKKTIVYTVSDYIMALEN